MNGNGTGPKHQRKRAAAAGAREPSAQQAPQGTNNGRLASSMPAKIHTSGYDSLMLSITSWV
ncbi:MAG: hypothetical protein R3E96_06385 [Planctomycetota bacterium]